jgi:hypothetical protein
MGPHPVVVQRNSRKACTNVLPEVFWVFLDLLGMLITNLNDAKLEVLY